MNDSELGATLVALQCDVQIIQMLLEALFAESPRQEQIQKRYRAEIERHCQEGLKHVGEEQVVELRARAAQIDRALSSLRQLSSAPAQARD